MDNRHLAFIRSKLQEDDLFFVERIFLSKEELITRIKASYPDIIKDLDALSSFDDFFSYFNKLLVEGFSKDLDLAFEVDGEIHSSCIFYILEQIYKFELNSLSVLSLSKDPKHLLTSTIKEVLSHMENYIPNDSDFVSRLVKNFPNYSFSGSAYRVIKTHQYNANEIEGVSFSISKQGILNYLKKDFHDPERNYTFIEHNVVGFNLIRFLYENQNLISNNDRQFIFDVYKDEDEVLVLKDLGEVSLFKFNSTEELLAFLNS